MMVVMTVVTVMVAVMVSVSSTGATGDHRAAGRSQRCDHHGSSVGEVQPGQLRSGLVRSHCLCGLDRVDARECVQNFLHEKSQMHHVRLRNAVHVVVQL